MLTRLRSRGAIGTRRPSENADDPACPSQEDDSSRRAVLGDVSNKRQPQNDAAGGKGARKQSVVTKKPKVTAKLAAPSGGAKAVETDHTAVAADVVVQKGSDEPTDDQRNARAPDAENVGNATRRVLKTRSAVSTSARRATRSTSRTTTNTNKRAGLEAQHDEARKQKRVKVSDGLNADAPQARAQTRARAQDDRPEHRDGITPSVARREDDEELKPRSLNFEYIVAPKHRLQRPCHSGAAHTDTIAPHDACDKENVLKVVPYVTDIFQHLYRAEARSCPEIYMHNQADINAKMRAILVDWLVEVHMKFHLVPETLYLCINIIDRYCSQVSVARSKLQLVGVTALLIACKYEEIYPPEVRDCVYITDRAYNRQEVLDMEQDMLQRLRFKITVPTAYPFLQRFLSLTKAPQLAQFAANYYMERTLQEHDLLQYKPSVVAASCVILALSNPDIPADTETLNPGMPRILLEYTGFEEKVLLSCAKLIATKVGEDPVTASKRQLVAVKRKYGHGKFRHVSTAISQPCVKYITTVKGRHNAGDA
eukprot:CAMPEP_0183323278 /NCGR_PEP_ID=MMETSP0160_2-20130417/73938_1 /TAXON_ID=2839 ORGANISM="Odontella Sinensis, Strain Grunow 1884" /NCGR_SAMPLE_ID=MMETSP0160_2 /ASSEMBLY_ACC=CAM_ASM_000250 /LENGTH=538 /DNA_ID=CAMNT_0025490607 /DNA_START=28 /DNA_END=1644 /DNA_ORIENTATION=-